MASDETLAVLKAFQEKHKTVLKVDGVAGKNTIALLDRLLVSTAKVELAAPRERRAAFAAVLVNA